MPTQSHKALGEFEQQIVLAILRQKNMAYGIEIAEVLKEVADRQVSIGALYTTLTRMQDKGILSSNKGQAMAERGGRAKLYYSVTPLGQKKIKQSLSQLDKLMQGLALKY